MKLSVEERRSIIEMIETQTFYGVPLEDISPTALEYMDVEDTKTLYIVISMIGCDYRDKDSYNNFPYDANEYLKKFRL